MNRNELPPPARYKSHASIQFDGNRFATAAVMRPGVGFAVKRVESFVQLDMRDSQNRRVVVSVDVDGVPALIAALQDAVRGSQ